MKTELKELETNNSEYLYRYTYYRCGVGIDVCGDPLPGHQIQLSLQRYRIIKRTPKGCWIDHYIDEKKFVLTSAKKKFAYPTEEEALDNFIQRKKRQIAHYQMKIADVDGAIFKAKILKRKKEKQNG